MGTCHVLMHENLLEKVRRQPYSTVIRIHSVGEFEEGYFNVLLETDILSEGYHGQQEIIVTEDSVEFRRDTDT